MSAQDDYNDVLIDKMLQWRSMSNFGDASLRFFCEAELNPGSEEKFLQMSQSMALLEIARQLSEIKKKS